MVEGDSMSEHPGPDDVEAVRAERDRLQDEVDRLEARPQKRARLRRVCFFAC